MIKPIISDITELKLVCADVITGEDVRNIVQDLKDTLNSKGHGVGLAANQIGYKKRIAYIKLGNIEFLMYNPHLRKKENRVMVVEECLSFPGLKVTTSRYNDIMLEYMDEDGNTKLRVFTGALSIIVQHELDHTNGMTMLDRKHRSK